MSKLVIDNKLSEKKEIEWKIGDYFISHGCLYLIVKNGNHSIHLINITLHVVLYSGLEGLLNTTIYNNYKDAVKVENVKITLS